MSKPKKYIRNYKLVPEKQGPKRRQEILNNISNKGTFLPRGVEIEDMDKAFLDSVDTDMEITIEGEKVPVFLLNSQRWAELSKTFDFTNEFKSLKIPFISVVRRPDIQPGTNHAGNWNIPQGNKTYTYMKVPTWDGNQKGMDIYKIPQPTSVDLTYEVRLFCDRMSELNKLHKVIQLLFQSRQHYINVKGHPMPVHLEAVSDESTMNDFENRRFYVQSFEMKLLGYLLNEDDMEVKPAIKRSMVFMEHIKTKNEIGFEKKIKFNDNDNKSLDYLFIFKEKSPNIFSFIVDCDKLFNKISDLNNLLTILIFINDVEVFNGLDIENDINIKKGDEITISISRINDKKDSNFLLLGENL